MITINIAGTELMTASCYCYCYLHVRMVRMCEAGPGLGVRVASRSHAS